MAFFNQRHCRKCGEVTEHNHSNCMVCAKREREEAEARWMALPLEERLLDIYRRLKALERGPLRF